MLDAQLTEALRLLRTAQGESCRVSVFACFAWRGVLVDPRALTVRCHRTFVTALHLVSCTSSCAM